MDAVILAAGRGSRLEGIAAPFHKPLLIHKGEALIARAVRQAVELECEVVTVVTAPENTLPIAQLLSQAPSHVNIIVQRQPTGPGTALELGSSIVGSPDMLVLMADNYTSDEDLEKVYQAHLPNSWTISIERMSIQDAQRFTYRDPRSGLWVEKEQSTVHHTTQTEVWVGPLAVDRSLFHRALHRWRMHPMMVDETPIGPLFNQGNFTTVEVGTVDLGVKEAL